MNQVLYIAWYRFRVTFGRRWSGYMSVVVLIGLTGGIAMASMAAGRRTQSSYPTFLASTNPSDMTVAVYSAAAHGGPSPVLTTEFARLPDVKRVRALVGPEIVPLAPNGVPRLQALGNVNIVASLDGMFLDQDRVTVVQGRLADPRRADEMVMTANAARRLGVNVGQVVPMGFYNRRADFSVGLRHSESGASSLWTLFAGNINAVPDPTVPVLWIFLVGLGALVFANLVAALPGHRAARTPTGLVLRAE